MAAGTSRAANRLAVDSGSSRGNIARAEEELGSSRRFRADTAAPAVEKPVKRTQGESTDREREYKERVRALEDELASLKEKLLSKSASARKEREVSYCGDVVTDILRGAGDYLEGEIEVENMSLREKADTLRKLFNTLTGERRHHESSQGEDSLKLKQEMRSLTLDYEYPSECET